MFNAIPVPLLRQYIVIITVNLLSLCVGMDLIWTSPMLVKLRNPEQTPLSHPITEDEGGWIVAIGYIVSIITLPFLGLLLDYLGRRRSVIMICLPKVIASTMTIFSTEVWMLLVARVINTTTSIAAMIVIMVYSTETASKEVRGSLGLIFSISCNLGVLLMLSVGPYISYLNLSILLTAVTVCLSIPLLFVPDTPYSLYNKGQVDKAKRVLVYFRGSEALAEDELKELAETKAEQKLLLKDIFKNKVYIKSLLIVMAMGVGTQLAGYNFISFYLQTILEISNTSVSPAVGSVIIGVTQIIASVVAGFVVDRFGRKPILVPTLLAMAVAMVGLGVFFMIKQQGVFISGFLNYLPLLCIGVLTCSFSGGIGSLYFVVVSELLDGPIRALGSALSLASSNFALFILSRYAMNIMSSMGSDYTFIMFGAFSVVMSLFILFFVPETKQKSVAEIQRALAGLKAEGKVSQDFEKF